MLSRDERSGSSLTESQPAGMGDCSKFSSFLEGSLLKKSSGLKLQRIDMWSGV